MDFTVPTNWQRDFPGAIDTSRISEIYGKLESDCVGGAHASFLLPPVHKRRAAEHVMQIHKRGIRFNYLLNPVCLANREWTNKGQKDIRRLLDWLSGTGVDCVTVGIPYLLQLIKKRYPHFQASVSVGAEVNTPFRARYWEDLGADAVTLSSIDVNRNFELLRKIRSCVSCKLQLIANLPCLPGCHMHQYHGAIASHASRGWRPSGSFIIDYCSLSCRHMRLSDPKKFVSAVWIRPEDVRHYAAAGIDRIKLVDRGMRTEILARIIGAYSKESYEGNLMDLFPFNAGTRVVSSPRYFFKNLRYFFRPFDVDLSRLLEHSRACADNPVYLDNRMLDGFLDHFIQGKCPGSDCDSCGYCRRIADKALRIPEESGEKTRKAYERFLEDLIGGRLFYQ